MKHSLVYERVSLAVLSGQPVRLVADRTAPGHHERMLALLDALLNHYGQSHLLDCLHSCCVELVTNALRANWKYIYLKDRKALEADDETYSKALADFRLLRRKPDWTESFVDRSEQEGLYVHLDVHHDQDGLTIEVTNNLPLREVDEQRLRQKFAQAMRMGESSLVDFYDNYGDDTEGCGLGVALNVLYLRSSQLDPALLRIGSSADRTTARLEVPFSRRFESRRGEFQFVRS